MSSPMNFAIWREQVGRRLLNLDFRSHGDRPFSYDIKPIMMTDSMRVAVSRHGPGFTFRDQKLVRDGNDSLALVYPLQGRLTYTQAQDVMLEAHEPVLIDTRRPGELGATSACRYVSLLFPPDSLPPDHRACLENRSWPRRAPALSLLRAYIDTLGRSTVEPDSDLAETTRRHVLDLVRLAAIECREADPRDLLASGTIGESRVRIALGDIRKSFRDPHLSEIAIARRQGIGQRHLQRLFERSGLRFTDSVNELRLQAAHAALRDPAWGPRTVMEIAFDSGFSDISHFNRLFKRRYGMTPTDVRLGARAR